VSTDVTTEQQTPAQVRLAAAKAQLAAQQAGAAAPTNEQDHPLTLPQPGSVVHVLRSGLTVHTGGEAGVSGVVVAKGQNIVITDAMVQATKNRLGEYTGIALAADEDAQIRKYGEVRFRVGEAPSDLRPWTYGDADWSAARDAARRQAWSQPTDAARADALAEVERVFGPAAATSTTTNSAPNKSIAEAAVQAERLAARSAQGMR
jgi:hypothetical protein